MAQSKPEAEFALFCRAHKLEPVAEFKFCPTRRWRADFGFPAQMMLVEIEGGIWTNGRHNRGSGFEADCEKYNHASLMGYRVFRFTPKMVASGEAIRIVQEAIANGN